MNWRTLINVVLVAGLGYAIYCGYQYLQLRNAITDELSSKPALIKLIGDVSTVKIDMSQYPTVSCTESAPNLTWWQMIIKERSQGCLRLSVGLQSDNMKTLTVSADYHSDKPVGQRLSHVLLCEKPNEIVARDNNIPRKYMTCL